MKKGMILACLLAGLCLAGAANASLIELGTTDCGTLRQCYSIPTDTGDAVTFINGTASYYAYLTVDGVVYRGYPVLPLGTSVFTSFPMTAADGSVALFSATFTSYRTCTTSGRGQTCVYHWALVNGTVQR
jgi:hypothetical protein